MGEKKQAAKGWIGITIIIAIIVGVVFIFLPEESETEQNNIEKSDTSKAQDEALQKEIDDAAWQKKLDAALEKERLAETKDNEQINNLDPVTIQKIKDEFPILLEDHKKVLRDCQNIDSFEDYRSSLSKLGGKTIEETIEEFEYNHSLIFWDLANKGYDKHPEVKSLFQETERGSLDVLYCLDDVYAKYS